MAQESYKTKLEYGVSAIVAFVGVFFVYQASTIGGSSEAVGPRTMPMALAITLLLGAVFLESYSVGQSEPPVAAGLPLATPQGRR